MENNKTLFLTILLITTLALTNLSLSADASDFSEESFFKEDTGPEYSISGEFEPEFRIFKDDDNTGIPSLEIRFDYEMDKGDFSTLVDYNKLGKDNIDLRELYYHISLNKYEFTIGKKRLVWGKGDKIHVVDNINGQDYTDFLNQDYLDRQLGEEMVKLDRYFNGGNDVLELVYTPGFSDHEYATNIDGSLGNWTINPQWLITNPRAKTVFNSMETKYSTTQMIDSLQDNLPDYDNNHQFALRYTKTQRGFDYGFSYYRGYLRKPSYDLSVLNNPNLKQILKNSTLDTVTDSLDPHYDNVDVLGGELASVIKGINTRAEIAYYRTDDTEGDNPEVRNNKIAWILGGDKDLPISNLNLNLQVMSEKILDDDKIEENPYDLQYRSDGDYLTNRIILKLSDSFKNEKIQPELSWIYNYEDKDYSLKGSIDYKLKDNLHLETTYKIFKGDSDTLFGQFAENDYTSVKIRYSF